LRPDQLDVLSRPYLLRIDLAYAKLKQAERAGDCARETTIFRQ
jgi:hypothetical protein